MPLAENIFIFQERSGGAVRVFVDIKKFPALKVSAFSKAQNKTLEKLFRLVINIVQSGNPRATGSNTPFLTAFIDDKGSVLLAVRAMLVI